MRHQTATTFTGQVRRAAARLVRCHRIARGETRVDRKLVTASSADESLRCSRSRVHRTFVGCEVDRFGETAFLSQFREPTCAPALSDAGDSGGLLDADGRTARLARSIGYAASSTSAFESLPMDIAPALPIVDTIYTENRSGSCRGPPCWSAILISRRRCSWTTRIRPAVCR